MARIKTDWLMDRILHCLFFAFRCEGQPSDSSAPLATNDSDDDISDDESTGVRCEEVFSR